MALTDLNQIRDKVRRLVRAPSPFQMTDAELNQYINTFVLYGIPQNLKLFSLRTLFTFYTQPHVGEYATSTNVNSALFDFKNKYTSVHPPVFIDGVPSWYTQQRELFWRNFSQTKTERDTQLRGNNTTGPYNGTIDARPIEQGTVVFSAQDTSGFSMTLVDYPVSSTTGALGLVNQPQTLPSPFGSISYLDGTFTVVFPNAVATGETVFVSFRPYKAGRPISVLFYDNIFTLRPIPDKVYAVQMEANIVPTELLQSSPDPQIKQWWQYIAFGAARKIFEDRLDTQSLSQLMPLYEHQEILVQRSTIEQETNKSTITIYDYGRPRFNAFWNQQWPF